MLVRQNDYNSCMPTLKQEGNQAFKNRKYKEALKYYEQYVQQQHSDNQNAYFNLGLCYSKLGQHIKSIEACKNATVLDPQYSKAYYRMMKEYDEISNHYEVFINAQQYIKTSHDQESTELLSQAKQYIKASRMKLTSMPKRKQLQDSDEMFSLIEPFKPILENSNEFNEQIDKYPYEWIDQWAANIQSQDAKWQEIAYIIRQINPHYGVSLAHYYYNQIKRSPQAKDIYQQIKGIKGEINFTEKVDYLENYVELTYNEDIGQDYQKKEVSVVKDQTNKHQVSQKTIKTTKLPQQKIKNEVQIQSNKPKKIQDVLQSKANIKKDYEQAHKPQNKPSQKNKTTLPKPSPVQQQNKVVSLPRQAPRKQKEEEPKLQELYQHYCGKIQKSKDIFTQVYRSIYQILMGKQQQMKGKLLMLLKKRVKKLKVIITSLSDNEQKVVYDLLKKSNMEEYAVDFAPAYFKL